MACKLYRPGSVGFVSKSGGMSNEMYNVLSRTTDGLYEGGPLSPKALNPEPLQSEPCQALVPFGEIAAKGLAMKG